MNSNQYSVREKININFPINEEVIFEGKKLSETFGKSFVECGFSRSEYVNNPQMSMRALEDTPYSPNKIKVNGRSLSEDNPLRLELETICLETRDSVLPQISRDIASYNSSQASL